jgi:hypothetical protein
VESAMSFATVSIGTHQRRDPRPKAEPQPATAERFPRHQARATCLAGLCFLSTLPSRISRPRTL